MKMMVAGMEIFSQILAWVSVKFQGEKLSETTVIKEPWLVQGRRGTNPFKDKNRIKKEALPTLKDCDAA